MSSDAASAPGALTHAQAQILVGQRLHPRSPLYNMAFAFRFEAGLDTERFCQAWRIVADGSDALRTRIVTDAPAETARRLTARAPATAVERLEEGQDDPAAFERWCRARCRRPLPLDGALADSVLVPLADGSTGWYLNQHHAITDAASTALLVERVGAQYRALASGESTGHVDFPSYYAVAKGLAAPSAGQASLDHWAERRRGAALSLYGRPPRPPSLPATRETVVLDEARSAALERLCAEAGFTTFSPDLTRFNVFATLLAAWLWRVSGDPAVGFDAPVAGRPSPEAKRTPGCFIELFPFAVDVRMDDTFRRLAGRCLEESLAFLAHGKPGLSAPSSATAGAVALNYVPVRLDGFEGGLDDVQWLHPGDGDPVHALWLQVHDFSGHGRLTLHFDANDALFPAPLRRRMKDHFLALLDALLDDPDGAVGAVDLLLGEEREALRRLNDTGDAALPKSTVVARFEAVAAAHGARVALRQGAREMSFAALADRVAHLARTLRAQGVVAGDRVVVCGRRSIGAVTAILAVLQARAVWVPADPAAPTARLAETVADSGARLVMVGEGAEWVTGEVDAPTLDVDAPDTWPQGEGALVPGPALDDPAYILYTSGSTGRPKGVAVNHLGLADYLAWAERTYVRGDRLSFALFTPLTVDLTLTSLFLPLLTGGTLEIYPESDGAADTAWMDVLDADAVDFIKLTPSHLSLMVQRGLQGSRIRRLVLGGENLPVQVAAEAVRQLEAASPGAPEREGRPAPVELVNEYGPTEAVVGCVAHRFDPERDRDASVPIGVPVDHVRVAVVAEAAGETVFPPAVPVGIPGELWVARPGLALGYHGREDLTRDRFVAPGEAGPETPRDAAGDAVRRWYRTGDRVRLREDGVLEYLGRLDRQLKVAGFRVEPGEIEQALRALPGVSDAAVLLVERGGRPQLAACWVADEAVPETVDPVPGDETNAFRAALARRLPAPLIPGLWARVDVLPLGPSGKLDEGALAARFATMDAATRPWRAPEGPVAEHLAELWAAELGVDRVGADDHFFELGGSSLDAMQVMLRLCRDFDIELPVDAPFAHPVLADLARLAEDRILADAEDLPPAD